MLVVNSGLCTWPDRQPTYSTSAPDVSWLLVLLFLIQYWCIDCFRLAIWSTVGLCHQATHSPVSSYTIYLPANQFSIHYMSFPLVPMSCLLLCIAMFPSTVHNSFCLPVCHFQQEVIDWALCRDSVHAPLLDDSMTHFRSNLGVIFLAHCNPFFIVLRWLQPLLTSLRWVFIIFKHSACLYLLWRI